MFYNMDFGEESSDRMLSGIVAAWPGAAFGWTKGVHIILYDTIRYDTIRYDTILYYTTLYYTIPGSFEIA